MARKVMFGYDDALKVRRPKDREFYKLIHDAMGSHATTTTSSTSSTTTTTA